MLPADQLVRRGNPHHVGHSRHAAQVERAQVVDVANEPHDRPGHAAADESVAACRPHQVDDAVDFGFSGLCGHHYYHAVRPPENKKRPRASGPGLSLGLSVSAWHGRRPSGNRAGSQTKTRRTADAWESLYLIEWRTGAERRSVEHDSAPGRRLGETIRVFVEDLAEEVRAVDDHLEACRLQSRSGIRHSIADHQRDRDLLRTARHDDRYRLTRRDDGALAGRLRDDHALRLVAT